MAKKSKAAKAVKKTDEPSPSWLKRTFNVIKDWIVGNGIEGIAGFAFGVFATRNWDLAKSSILKLIK